MKQRIPQSVILEIRAYRKLRDTDKQEDIIHPSPVTTFTLPHTLPTVIRHRIPQFEKNEVTCTSGVYMYPCAWEMKPMYLQNLPLMSQILYFLMEFAYFVVSVCAMLISADLPPSLCPVVGLVTAFRAVRRLSTQMLSTPPSLLSLTIINNYPLSR